MRQVSKRQAEQVLAAVKAKYAEDVEYFGAPKLYPPGFHASGWTVAWECGPEDWVYRYTDYAQPGLFLEPVNHWCLGVYRDE